MWIRPRRRLCIQNVCLVVILLELVSPSSFMHSDSTDCCFKLLLFCNLFPFLDIINFSCPPSSLINHSLMNMRHKKQTNRITLKHDNDNSRNKTSRVIDFILPIAWDDKMIVVLNWIGHWSNLLFYLILKLMKVKLKQISFLTSIFTRGRLASRCQRLQESSREREMF